MNWDQLCVRNANYYCNSANKNLTRNDLTPKMNNLLNNSTLHETDETDETTNKPLLNKTTELPLLNKTTEVPLVNETTDKPFNPLLNKTDKTDKTDNNENKNTEDKNKKNSSNKNLLDNNILILTSIFIILIIN
jgi:hypothetical protein